MAAGIGDDGGSEGGGGCKGGGGRGGGGEGTGDREGEAVVRGTSPAAVGTRGGVGDVGGVTEGDTAAARPAAVPPTPSAPSPMAPDVLGGADGDSCVAGEVEAAETGDGAGEVVFAGVRAAVARGGCWLRASGVDGAGAALEAGEVVPTA